MKKVSLLLVMALIVSLFSINGFAQEHKLDTSKLSKGIAENMKAKGLNVRVDVEVLTKLENVEGFYLVKLIFVDKDKGNAIAGEQQIFTDGNVLAQDFLNANGMTSLMKEIQYEASSVNINTKELTLAHGSADAKNVIVEITDFQCPYCAQASSYIHNKIKDRKDVALYILHMPIATIHPKAELMAKIFEAGAIMGQNYKQDLFADATTRLSDGQLIEKYGKKAGNEKKFAELVTSKEVADKVANTKMMAQQLGIASTPTIIINNKLISGFDAVIIDKALSDF